MKRPSLVGLLVGLALVIAAIVWLDRLTDRQQALEQGAPGAAEGGAARPGARAARPSSVPAAPLPATIVRDRSAAAGLLEGRVVARGTTRGVRGAQLAFRQGSTLLQTRTDRDGEFQLVPLVPGRYELVAAEAEGFLSFLPAWGHSPISFDARPGERVSGIVLQLVPAASLRVHVVGPDGQPLGGAEVSVAPGDSDEAVLAPDGQAAVTDAAGDTTVQVAEGSWVKARHAGYADGRAPVGPSTLPTGVLVVKLGLEPAQPEEASTLAGRVVDARGAPVAGVRVVAYVMGSGSPTAAASDAQGAFTLSPEPAGSYLVVARASAARIATARDVAPGTRDLLLRLPDATGELTVRVRDGESGAPVTAFAVGLEGPLDGGPPLVAAASRAVFDSQGSYVWGELPAGRYVVYVAAYDYAPVRLTVMLTEGARASVDADLQAGGRVAGTVSVEGTGQPVAGARVVVQGSTPEGASVAPLQSEGATDADGAFVVAGVAPGLRSVSASATGYHIRIVSGVLVRRGEVTHVAISLGPLAPGEQAKTELVGIGAYLSLEEGALVIRQVVPGGGAALATLGPGDRIVAVDGRPIGDLSYEDAVEAIRGVPGSRVLLAVVKAGTTSPVDVWVERRNIKL